MNIPSMHDLLKIAQHVDQGIKYLENELKFPDKLIYSKTQDKIDEAEMLLQLFVKEVDDSKNEIKSEVKNFESCLKESEEHSRTIELCLDDIHRDLQSLETKFKDCGYIPYKFPGIEDETDMSNLCDELSTESLEHNENISPVLNVDITPDETYLVRRFNPSLNSTLIKTEFSVNGNITADIFDNNWNAERNKQRALKSSQNLLTPNNRFGYRVPISQQLCTPPDPGCSLLSLEVTGRSVRRYKKN